MTSDFLFLLKKQNRSKKYITVIVVKMPHSLSIVEHTVSLTFKNWVTK